MTTQAQERWMVLVDLLNSDEFDFPSTWFEDSDGNRSTLMANRTVAAKHIPLDVHRMRIDGSIWVRGDDWIHHDIQMVYDKLSKRSEYLVSIVDDTLYIELTPGNSA